MIVANGSDYTLIAIGLIGTIIFFILQLIFCFKAKKVAIKLIPTYLILLVALHCIATYLGFFGSYAAGSISGNQLVALIEGIVIGIATVGEVLAWVVYWLITQIKKKQINT